MGNNIPGKEQETKIGRSEGRISAPPLNVFGIGSVSQGGILNQNQDQN
jgi:hypothetical protein